MSQISQIKEATDIVSVIGQRLDLQRSGSSFRALCPFHSEKSPSFFVNPQLQRYRCFGCGARGDVLEFLQQYEGMSFYEALQHLAAEAGIELKQFSKTNEDELREQIQHVLELSARYYNYLLTEHQAGENAREYLKNRGIQSSSIKFFNLGYCLTTWDGLINYLTKKKKISLEVIEQSGLAIRNQSGRYYDRFRDRIIFPLKNHRGQVVGFSGRLISQEESDSHHKQPKYINTPETILYHKAKTLFGYSELFQYIRKKKEVIVCEGEFDVISSHQTHVSHIVAIKGSALTAEQAKLLERTVERVIITLDSDEAGVKATRRAIDVIGQTNLDLRIIDLSQANLDPKAQDVDDLVTRNSSLWKDLSKQSLSAYEFLINVAFASHDENSATGRREIVNELAPILKNISHEVEKDFYLKKIASRLNLAVGILSKDINRFGSLKNNSRSNYGIKKQDESKQTLLEQLHEYLLFLLFNSDESQTILKANQLIELGVFSSQSQQLLEALVNFKFNYSLASFASSLAEDLKGTLMEWCHHPQYFDNISKLDIEKEWKKAIKKFEQLLISAKIEKLNQKLALVDKEKNIKENISQSNKELKMAKLLQEIATLQNKLKVILMKDL